MTPFDWNIIVIGAWNTAILTPAGIQKRIFEIPNSTPIAVEVPLHARGHIRVRHNGMIVVPAEQSLTIQPEKSGYQELEQASEYAKRAIKSLPETPYVAAGVNFRFKFEKFEPSVISRFGTEMDDLLGDEGQEITSSFIRKTTSQDPGVLNLEVDLFHDTGKGSVLFNFHRDSADPDELCSWLDLQCEFKEKMVKLLQSLFDENYTEGE